jgi:hypothetical protein
MTLQDTTPPSKPPKKVKPKSRAKRWAEASSNALFALEQLSGHVADLENALSELRGVQEEYEEWKDNLPENLASSALGEKLEEVCNLEIEDAAQSIRDAIDEVTSTIENADGVDLPQGFGRD